MGWAVFAPREEGGGADSAPPQNFIIIGLISIKLDRKIEYVTLYKLSITWFHILNNMIFTSLNHCLVQ